MISCTKSDLPPVGKGNFIELTLSSSISSVTLNSAVISIKYTDPNETSIIERGICWSTTTLPTVSNSKATISGTSSSGITSNVTITGLTQSTKYYFRYYVKNNVGVFYSNELEITTATPQKAVLTTNAAVSITTNSALTGGDISSDGYVPVTKRGVCYSTISGPTINNSITSNGTSTGTFESLLSGLTPGTKYYIRAYATNIAGTSYGNEVSFTTIAIYKPSINTNNVSNITGYSALIGGTIVSNGNSTIAQSGVCYSISPNPTTANSRTIDGLSSGSFSSQINGLDPNTTYYVRAYASNAAGTGYGAEISFTTVGPDACNITGTTTGTWYNMIISSTGPYVVGSNYTIAWRERIFIPPNLTNSSNYVMAEKVSLYKNDTEVYVWGGYNVGFAWTIGIPSSFPLPNVSPSGCYTVRVFTIENTGQYLLPKVYVSPNFTIN